MAQAGQLWHGYARRMSTENVHRPVLLRETMELLQLRPGARCVDATIDGGGHAAAMLDASAPDGVVLGIDRDPALLIAVRQRLAAAVAAGRLKLAAGSFRDLGAILSSHSLDSVDAALFDLGVSSFHFDASGRGFSFAREEPLDMRFDPGDASAEPAARLLATLDDRALTQLFRDFGDERFASRIARTITARRRAHPITTTGALLEAITAALPARVRWRANRSAARIFQALRIAVNNELHAIAAALPQAVAALAPGGRLAVIAFHSLEDRLIKNFFRDQQQAGQLRILTKKPITPADEEIAANPRAASAKLRVAERTSSGVRREA